MKSAVADLSVVETVCDGALPGSTPKEIGCACAVAEHSTNIVASAVSASPSSAASVGLGSAPKKSTDLETTRRLDTSLCDHRCRARLLAGDSGRAEATAGARSDHRCDLHDAMSDPGISRSADHGAANDKCGLCFDWTPAFGGEHASADLHPREFIPINVFA